MKTRDTHEIIYREHMTFSPLIGAVKAIGLGVGGVVLVFLIITLAIYFYEIVTKL